jgi:methylamine dehydrogenase accessory protein MauD
MILALTAILLAAVLAVSGAAKLLDLRGSAASLRGFGTPERLVPALSLALPLAELAIAAALVPVATGRAAAGVATLLFCSFAIVIAVTLLRGRRPDCGCFGRLHSAPIGLGTFSRMVGLAGVAAVLAWRGTGAGVGVLDEPAAWLAAVTGGQSVLLVAVLRRHGRTLSRLDELEATPDAVQLARGSSAPDFTLPDLDGRPVSLSDLRVDGRPTLLVFAHPGCGPCTALLPDIARWQTEHRRRVTVALITQGGAEPNRSHTEEHLLDLVLLQEESEVAEAYGVQGTPGAVVVDRDGLVDGPLQYGAEGVETLLARALELSPAPRRRVAALVAAAATSAVAATPALAARDDDEDDAIAQLKRILKARDPALRRATNRVAAKTTSLFGAPRSAAVKFELTAAIALAKKEIRWTIEELDAVPVPDYRPGEKGARIAKSDAISSFSLLDLVLAQYVKALKTRSLSERKRLDAEIVRLTIEAEKKRRLASKRMGCTKKLEEC